MDAIQSEVSDDQKEGLKAVVMSIRNPPAYFADKLWNSIGTKDHVTVVRIMVSRFEVDLAEIKKIFTESRKVALAMALEGASKGDYRKILVALASRDENAPFV